jgi:ribosomal protein S18 acetylase RimI-like enzyme
MLRLRETVATDLEPLLHVAQSTAVFNQDEMECLRYDIDHFLSDNSDGDSMFSLWEDDQLAGLIHYGPLSISDRGMMLFWILIGPQLRSSGAAKVMVNHMETHLQEKGARIIFIETADSEDFLAARRFYLKCGYEQVCVIPDFYAKGVAKTMFSKSL